MSATGFQQKTRGTMGFEFLTLVQTYSVTLVRAKDAVASMIKRLAHRNANVQLYTLEVRRTGKKKTRSLTNQPQLANALSQNCGSKMHMELASRSFTDALLRLANDRVGMEYK